MKHLLRDREIFSTLAVFVLVSIFIVSTFLFGAFSWFIFWPIFIVAGFLIALRPRVGLFSIILLTMIWERFFTLQPIILSGRIIKLYPLDILLAVTAIAFFVVQFVQDLRTRAYRADR